MKKIRGLDTLGEVGKELKARHEDHKEAAKMLKSRKEKRKWDRTVEKIAEAHPEFLDELKER